MSTSTAPRTERPALQVRLKKTGDGPAVLTCVRPDGSATWHRLPDAFPVHDLTHFVVETTLGFRRGFFGMMAEGWDITDFGSPWPKGRLPAETVAAEVTVGVFWREFFDQPLEIAALNQTLASTMPEGVPAGRSSLAATDIALIRERLAGLVGQWRALPRGSTMELTFPIEEIGQH